MNQWKYKRYVLIFVVFVVFYTNSTTPGPEEIAVTDFSMAYALNGKTQKSNEIPTEAVMVCGFLESQIPVWWQIYLFDNNNEVAGRGKPSLHTQPGDFCESILILIQSRMLLLISFFGNGLQGIVILNRGNTQLS
ncbi:MAG: hypothetical protein ACRDFQ_01330, partial [Anaerolineales bacterium]